MTSDEYVNTRTVYCLSWSQFFQLSQRPQRSPQTTDNRRLAYPTTAGSVGGLRKTSEWHPPVLVPPLVKFRQHKLPLD